MVRKLRLPFRAIEGGSLVGPIFWCDYDQDEDDRHLRKQPEPPVSYYSTSITPVPRLWDAFYVTDQS
jgi:hypothetical protein